MKHMTKERTCADAMLELEQLRDGSMPPENTPALANPMYARAYDRFLREGNVTNTLREGADNEVPRGEGIRPGGLGARGGRHPRHGG